jgi:hypothetical protein
MFVYERLFYLNGVTVPAPCSQQSCPFHGGRGKEKIGDTEFGIIVLIWYGDAVGEAGRFAGSVSLCQNMSRRLLTDGAP